MQRLRCSGCRNVRRDLERCGEALGSGLPVAAVIGSGIRATRLTDDVAVQLLENALAAVEALGVLIAVLRPNSGPTATLWSRRWNGTSRYPGERGQWLFAPQFVSLSPSSGMRIEDNCPSGWTRLECSDRAGVPQRTACAPCRRDGDEHPVPHRRGVVMRCRWLSSLIRRCLKQSSRGDNPL